MDVSQPCHEWIEALCRDDERKDGGAGFGERTYDAKVDREHVVMIRSSVCCVMLLSPTVIPIAFLHWTGLGCLPCVSDVNHVKSLEAYQQQSHAQSIRLGETAFCLQGYSNGIVPDQKQEDPIKQ